MSVHLQEEIDVAANLGNRWGIRHYAVDLMVVVVVSVREWNCVFILVKLQR